MRTPKQIAASRTNGAKSKGPVTAQGKRNSSRNSIRHGLLADTIVLDEEKRDEFFELFDELLDEHQPATPTELMMVETIAAARWKQNRIWGMQKIAFDHDVSSSPDPSAIPPLRAVLSLQSSPEKIRSHELLLRYDIAFDRQISRALLRLQQLQDRRSQRTARGLEVPDPDQNTRSAPATEDTQPPEESVAPLTIPAKSVPQSIRSRPAVDSLRPAVDSLRPAVDLLRPAVDLLRPAVDLIRPAVDLIRPAVDLIRPAVDLIRPAVDLIRPAVDLIRPAVDLIWKDVLAKRTRQINENNMAQMTKTQELPNLDSAAANRPNAASVNQKVFRSIPRSK